MYHSISADPESGVAPYYKVCTSPERFAEHMQWLADWGYRGVTLSAGLAALREQGAGSKEQGAKPEPTLTPSSPVAGRLDEPAILSAIGLATAEGLATAGLPHPLSTSLPHSLSPSVPPSPSPSPPHSQLSALSSQLFPKLVAITFDDGFRDFHTAAFPVLQRHGFSATMFLPTAFIGDDRPVSGGGERRTFKDRECLTWAEVKQLEAAGIEFGSHTVNHPRLVELDWPAIESELRDSQATLEQRLGHPVRGFAYPFAFPSADRAFTTRFKQTLDTLGYETCVTTEIGRVRPGDEPLLLKRLPANEADDAALLGAKLAGAYDWLHWPQTVAKRLKALR